MKTLEDILQSRIARHGISLLLGLVVGVFFHYMLFRLTLPVKPFIYVAF